MEEQKVNDLTPQPPLRMERGRIWKKYFEVDMEEQKVWSYTTVPLLLQVEKEMEDEA